MKPGGSIGEPATTETGLVVPVPNFIDVGDVIRVKNRSKSLDLARGHMAENGRQTPDFLSVTGSDVPEGIVGRLPAAVGQAGVDGLVEDDDLVRAFALRVLGGLGYRMSTARNGTQAIVMLAARPTLSIDLLVTDVIMPELGGPELAAYLQSERPTLRVLYISGYHDPNGQRIEPLLAKPFSSIDLARRVRAVLDA